MVRLDSLILGLFMGIGIGLLLAVSIIDADAHEAPKGWTYPVACCSGYDCREESSVAIRETANGYLVVSTGELIAYNDRRVKHSPDGLFHGCWRGAKFDAAPLLCLFAPPRAF